MKSRFPRRPWIDVVSKGDLPITTEIEDKLPLNHLRVSVKTGQNIDILKDEVESMILNLINILQEREAVVNTISLSKSV